MKKVITTIVGCLIMIGGSLLNTGCASVYNSNRVRSNMQEKAIYASGNEQAIRMLNQGASPKSVLQVVPIVNARGVDGAMLSADVLNPTFWDTVTAEPGSALLAGAVDGAVVGGLYYLYDQSKSDGGGDDDEARTSGGGGNSSGNDTIVVNGDGNTVNTGDTAVPAVEAPATEE